MLLESVSLSDDDGRILLTPLLELASDIKYSYPDKDVTLLHSRERLLPIYPIEMHDQCECVGVELGRLKLTTYSTSWTKETASQCGARTTGH